MLNRKNLIACSIVSLAALAAPLSGAYAFVPGITVLPYMEAQEDVPATADTNAGEGKGYSDMTKKDCRALKKHKSNYSADEYKGRTSYCKSILKSKKKKAAAPKPQPDASSNSGGQ
jgi:hypothetical protein